MRQIDQSVDDPYPTMQVSKVYWADSQGTYGALQGTTVDIITGELADGH